MDKDIQLPTDVVEKILRARDALIVGDADEAYHQLYGIAHPKYDTFYPWQDMERQINYPVLYEKAINERRQVTEYATKLHQAQQESESLKGILENLESDYEALQARCDRHEKALAEVIEVSNAGKTLSRIDSHIAAIARKALSAGEGATPTPTDSVALVRYIREHYKPHGGGWKDFYGIALLSDEGIVNMYNQKEDKQ